MGKGSSREAGSQNGWDSCLDVGGAPEGGTKIISVFWLGYWVPRKYLSPSCLPFPKSMSVELGGIPLSAFTTVPHITQKQAIEGHS